jgi:cold shock protein
VATGTVKWFSGQKGYGFIQPDTGGKDVFVHISAVERAGLSGLQDGAKITYDVVPKGIGGKSEGDVREGDRRRPRRRGFHHSVTFTIMSERPDDELNYLPGLLTGRGTAITGRVGLVQFPKAWLVRRLQNI